MILGLRCVPLFVSLKIEFPSLLSQSITIARYLKLYILHNSLNAIYSNFSGTFNDKIMVNLSAGCWNSIFLDAYTYSTNYLIFAITVIITSIVFIWVYEKPKFYKLIFKRSKHSNILSPIESNEELVTNYNATLLDDLSNNQEAKKMPEVNSGSECSH